MVKNFLRLDFYNDFRKLSSLSGLLLFLAVAALLVRLCFSGQTPALPAWNALYWIILTFAALGEASRIKNPRSERIFLLTLGSPRAFILAKIIYNAILLIVISLLLVLLFLLLFPLENMHLGFFLMTSFSVCIGLSAVLTFTEALSSISGGGFVLSAVLGVPLCIPLLTAGTSSSLSALNGNLNENGILHTGIILLISLTASALSVILYPYLSKD